MASYIYTCACIHCFLLSQAVLQGILGISISSGVVDVEERGFPGSGMGAKVS
jgi:hypothetical protein